MYGGFLRFDKKGIGARFYLRSFCYKGAPKVSYLLFADDSIVFMRASLQGCNELKSILKEYEGISGQQVNIEKSAVLFSSNTIRQIRESIMATLGISKVLAKDRYFGLPIMVGRAKKREFQAIKDRIWKRLKGWQSKLLSVAGKAVLIQTMVQAIPVYVMSCVKLPKGFVQDLNMIIARFWWGNGREKKGIHWLNWDLLSVSKLDGGLGFKDFESFNLAFLAKQG